MDRKFSVMKTTAQQQTARQKAVGRARTRKKRAPVEAKMNDRWKKTVGTMKDTPESREAWELGEAWRRAQTDP